MIMEWKKQDDAFHGIWNGTRFVLAANKKSGRWEVVADGHKVKGDWLTARKAMNEVELQQQREVLRRSKELQHGTATN